MNEVCEIYVMSGEKQVTCLVRAVDVKIVEFLMDRFIQWNYPFEADLVIQRIRKPLPLELINLIKLTCDYCGSEITGTPITFTFHNRKYYFAALHV